MKNSYIKPIIIMSRTVFWSLLISCVFATSLFANDPTAAQSVKDVVVTVEYREATLSDVFDDIESKTGFTFLYNQPPVALSSKRINIKHTTETVAHVLRDIMGQTGLRFKQVNSSIAVKYPKKKALAATGTITGTVTNKKGKPVPTANVLLVEINRGTATNMEGEYTIEEVPAGTYMLRVSFVGYQTYKGQVTIEGGEVLQKDVTLKKKAVGLDALIVTGFGKESKVEFTGSASQVDISKQLENVPVVDATTALQGAVAGLEIATSSNTPGAPQNINIRGISSINAGGDPLIIIDGIPVKTGGFADAGDAIDNNSDAVSGVGLMATLNPQSIASITVLKGPVATAQYGARGSNGVIVITTKTGAKGETKYSFSVQRGVVSKAVDGIKSVNAFQAAELYREGRKNAGLPVPTDLPFWNGPNDDIPGVDDTNWQELTTRDHATTQSYILSARGGSETATFYGSFSYQNKENIVRTSEFTRVGGNLNFSYDFSDDIDITNQFTGSYAKQYGYREGDTYWGNPLAAETEVASFYPTHNRDGSWNFDMPQYNSLFTLLHDKSLTKVFRVINSTKLNIDILENLNFSSELGIDYVVNEQELYQSLIHGGGKDVHGAASGIYTRAFTGTLQNSLNYIWDINEDNTLEAQLVQSAQLYNYYRLSAQASGFGATGLYNLASASVPRAGYSMNIDGSLLSFLGKVHYSYKDKIFIDATLRKEASSKFADSHRWGTFYAFGGAWLLSSEDFLSSADWLDLLKIRASFGITGNSAIGRNRYQSFLGYSASYDGRGGAIAAQIGNRELTWEKAQKYNIGLTFELFNRLDGDVTYFHSKTYDLLYAVPLSRTTGFNNQFRNIGELVNKGIEFSLNVDLIRTQDLLVNLSGNFTYLQNEVTDLPKNATGAPINIVIAGLRYKAVEGYPVNAWYMRTYAGVNKHNGMPLWELNREPSQAEINSGKAFKLDRFGDKWLTSTYGLAEPEYQEASGMPTHYGSIGLTVSYKGFSVDASLYGSFGAKIYDNNAADYLGDGATPVNSGGALLTQLQRWQKPGDITDVPKRIYQNASRSNDASSRYLYDADYLRLTNVRLGYKVPANLLAELGAGVKNVSLFVVGRNLWTYRFDPDLKWGPETGDLGFVGFTAPALQSITFGFNIQF